MMSYKTDDVNICLWLHVHSYSWGKQAGDFDRSRRYITPHFSHLQMIAASQKSKEEINTPFITHQFVSFALLLNVLRYFYRLVGFFPHYPSSIFWPMLSAFNQITTRNPSPTNSPFLFLFSLSIYLSLSLSLSHLPLSHISFSFAFFSKLLITTTTTMTETIPFPHYLSNSLIVRTWLATWRVGWIGFNSTQISMNIK